MHTHSLHPCYLVEPENLPNGTEKQAQLSTKEKGLFKFKSQSRVCGEKHGDAIKLKRRCVDAHTNKRGMAREKPALSAISAENSLRTANHTAAAAYGHTGLNLNPQDIPDSAVLARVFSRKSERGRYPVSEH